MARPKQPIALIQAKGKKHLTKAEIEDRKSKEVKANCDKVDPPSYLPKTLKKEFERIAEELKRIDIMSNLDCEALARYIVSEYNYQKVTKKLLKTGVDNDKYFNYLLMQDKLFKQSRQAASDLGLTISSRCKLVIPTKTEEKPVNKFSKFMK
ncbi:phage terminase small subunit P27 family [Romboutsia hominis]|uniref:phage terminase small subunit P27 family n=1 Tax=Romboutsia hominis TaxID=1507512 RepID=UPI000A4BC1AB|nr:phage terminase small subunit P27 family [Romboutsia hominis]